MKNIPLFKVFMAPEAGNAVSEVLQSGFIGQGPKVDEFETKLQQYLNAKNLMTFIVSPI